MVEIKVVHEVPALEKLVEWIIANNVKVVPSPVVDVAPEDVKTAKVEETKPVKAKKTAEKKAEPVKPAAEEAPVEKAVTEEPVAEEKPAEAKTYTYEQLMAAAIAFRDKDINNMAKLRSLLPEFGVTSMNALKGDPAKINGYVARFIEIGGEI